MREVGEVGDGGGDGRRVEEEVDGRGDAVLVVAVGARLVERVDDTLVFPAT